MQLRHILSNINISNLLLQIKKYFKQDHFNNITETIQKFLACSIEKNFVIYECPTCKSTHKFKVTCKSRFCPSCGKKYSALWSEKTAAALIDVDHRAVLFTIPEELREFFFYDRTLLTKLTYAVNDIFKYQFNNIKSKNKRVHKIGKYSKRYFTNSDILHYGLITVIHTFGRDLKWNPHIHAIVTLGGFNKNYKYLKKKYFHAASIAGQWKKLVIDIVKNGNYENINLKNKAYTVTNKLYHNNKRLFFDVAKNNLNNNIYAIKYIGRYLARAPIAEYKIINFSNNKVTFYYESLADNKERVEVTLDTEIFLSKLIIHIPPKHFKMIKRFGIYSRNVKAEVKNAMKRMKKYVFKYSKTTFYQLEIWNNFKVNPFYCFNCGSKMRVKKISYFNLSTGSICWKEYHYRNWCKISLFLLSFFSLILNFYIFKIFYFILFIKKSNYNFLRYKKIPWNKSMG